MGKRQPPYYGELDDLLIIGNKYTLTCTYTVDESAFSFTNYTLSGNLIDRFGQDRATVTYAKSGTSDTTVTLTINASDTAGLQEGTYKIKATYTNDGDADDVLTFLVINMKLIE